jgi:hypothetical protein
MHDRGKEQTNQVPSASPILMESVRAAIEARHYSPRTADSYVQWIKRFLVTRRQRR